MAIKTVVKRLAKRLPLDDAAASLIETDNEQFDGQTIDISLAVPDTTEFDRMAGDDLGNPRFIAFLAEVAQTNGYTVEQVKHEAAKDFEAFMTAFRSKEAKALDAGPIVLDMPAQAQPEEVRASTEKEQAQQSAAQADPRATVLCPNRQNSDGDSIEVLASVCATCADRDGCPALQ